MTTTSTTAHRPVFLTVLVALGVIQAVIGAALGIFLLVDRNDADLLKSINDSEFADEHQITPNLLLIVGIVAIVLAVIIFVAAIGLSRGNHAARWVVAVALTAQAGLSLYSLVALHGEQQLTSTFTLAFSVFTLWFLFGNVHAKQFFGDLPAAT